jgi:hypothetical protein
MQLPRLLGYGQAKRLSEWSYKAGVHNYYLSLLIIAMGKRSSLLFKSENFPQKLF